MSEPVPPTAAGTPARVGWIDATFGIAGDMLLAALIDAGADVAVVRAGVAAVLGDAVRIEVTPTARRGQRATAVEVVPTAPDAAHRPWRAIRDLIGASELPARVRDRALAVFSRLARAEGRVHGVPADDVIFHEVGSWDSISDVVGVCVALEDLGVDRLRTSTVTLGEGTVTSAHGLLAVPGPAVLELLAGSPMTARSLPPDAERAAGGEKAPAGGEYEPVGELATPTGVALLVALCAGDDGESWDVACSRDAERDSAGPAGPPTVIERVGVGAGRKDTPGWANVTRVVLGPLTAGEAPGSVAGARAAAETDPTRRGTEDLVRHLIVLETTVDDLDPRAWPSVLRGCLDAGALDAWLVPALGKKGRPAQVLTALIDPGDASADRVRAHVLAATGTLGFREYAVQRTALRRAVREVRVRLDGPSGPVEALVRVKLGVRAGRVVHATPEYEDCATLAARAGRPVLDALDAAGAAAHASGWLPGAVCDGPACDGPACDDPACDDPA